MSTNRIQKMIQRAHRDGQSVDDLLAEIDLVQRLAAEQGLGRRSES